MAFKFGYLILGAVVLSFGACIARAPQEPATVIQLQTPEVATAEAGETAPEMAPEGDAETETQLVAYQQYQQDYLAALASTSDLAQAEWNTFLRCRASAVALSAQADAEANNTGIEAELLKRLRAVNQGAKSMAEGKRFYSHDAAGAGTFRDPAVDTIVLINLLQEMQSGNPNFPMCSQAAGSLWKSVDKILSSSDDVARGADSVPVEVPKVDPGEVANETH
jgi:hypothetical protein